MRKTKFPYLYYCTKCKLKIRTKTNYHALLRKKFIIKRENISYGITKVICTHSCGGVIVENESEKINRKKRNKENRNKI